jgi:transcriptional regulator with XRE-family HTH domain
MGKKKTVKKVSVKEKPVITKLATIMFQNSITVEDLVSETGLGRNLVSKIKNNRQANPTINSLERIAQAITKLTGQKVKVEDIF